MPSPQPDESEYATHLPILRRFKPKRVLEFGAGFYSTALFLSMPKLERLVSVETDPKWRTRLREEYSDPRWELTTKHHEPKDFDLVLIDDGTTIGERCKTIRWVLGQEHPRVVIHDAETPDYREIYQAHPHILYALEIPQTAVVMP